MIIRSRTFRESYYEDIKLFQTIWIRFFMVLFLLIMAGLPWWGNPYLIYLVNLSCIAVVAALGLNLLTGFTGQISMGHAAFVAIGAYVTAILSSKAGWPFWMCLLATINHCLKLLFYKICGLDPAILIMDSEYTIFN